MSSNHAPFNAHDYGVWLLKPKVFIIAPQWNSQLDRKRGTRQHPHMHHPVPQASTGHGKLATHIPQLTHGTHMTTYSTRPLYNAATPQVTSFPVWERQHILHKIKPTARPRILPTKLSPLHVLASFLSAPLTANSNRGSLLH